MCGHRLGTDQQETVVVASCPEDCQAFELEVSGDPDAIDELVETALSAYDNCAECGGSFSWVRQDEQKEVLE